MHDDLIAHYRTELSRVIRDRPWIVAKDVLAGCTRPVADLQALGAARVMAIGASRGAGALPDPSIVPSVLLDLPAADMMAAIRQADAALADLPAAARAAVDAFDPDHQARVVSTLFSSGKPVGGRPIWGARPAAWQALEDKTVVDALWDAVGVSRAPSQVVPVRARDLRAAAERLDQGAGTVWAADNSHGFHGAAQGLRWVRPLDTSAGQGDADGAVAFLKSAAAHARVMPFVEGVPCSIHGWVFPAPFEDPRGAAGAEAPGAHAAPAMSHTIALRPCEMVVLRAPGTPKLHYARAATFWDPPPADRAALRHTARRVGDHLARTVGYRGVFTVDGVMGADGFVPTELNPRYGAALAVMSGSLPALPTYFLHLATAAGEDLDFRPLALERLLVDAADRHRQGGVGWLFPGVDPQERNGQLVALGAAADGSLQVVPQGACPADGTVVGEATLGPHPSGAYVRISLDGASLPPGPPLAPRAVAALQAVAAAWGLDLEPLAGAPDVRGHA